MSPKRIQRKRTKGWQMPEGAVYVGRPTKWGNPFIFRDQTMGLVQEPGIGGDRAWDYEGRISAPDTGHDFHFGDGRIVRCWNRWATPTELVELFRLTITEPTTSMRMSYPSKGGRFTEVTVEDIRTQLAGKDLACWCGLDQPCHADVLLELANQHVHTWIELDPTQGLTDDEIAAYCKDMRERCGCGEYRRWPVKR